MDNLKRNKLKMLAELQNQLYQMLTSNNSSQNDELRIENAHQLISDYVNSIPSFIPYDEPFIDKKRQCASCNFWEPYIRSGICTQKIKDSASKSLFNQETLEHYGCNIWEGK